MRFFPNKFLLNILTCGLILSGPLNYVTAATPADKPQATESKLNWKNYDFTPSGFSVDFPKKPEHINQTIDIPKTDFKIKYETYLSEPSDDSVFVVSVWNYPVEIDMSKPEVNLQDGFKGMLSALPGSEVISMNVADIKGFKALEFLVKNEDIYFQGKLLLVHNTLYQIFTVYKNTEDMKNNYQHFVDSFKLINPEQHQAAPSKNGKRDSKKMSL